MTEIQKTQILEMRQMGNTYKHIATTLFIPKGTVKSFCLRAEKKGLFAPHPQQENTLCKQCGKEIVQVENARGGSSAARHAVRSGGTPTYIW